MGTAGIELKTETAIALGISIPLLVFMLACLCVCACRRYRNQQPVVRGYSKVGEDLDEEEIEFKRMIENRVPENGTDEEEDVDVENLFGADEFSDRDKDRLSMLENFRSNLVKGATSFNSRDSESDSETDKMRL